MMPVAKVAAFTCALFMGVACVDAACVSAMPAKSAPERPIRSVYLAIAEGAQHEFVEQLKRFADANAFAMRLGETHPQGDHILVQMWREDIKVIVVNPFDPREFRVSFYENSAEPVVAESLSSLVDNFRSLVGLVRGATFLEREN